MIQQKIIINPIYNFVQKTKKEVVTVSPFQIEIEYKSQKLVFGFSVYQSKSIKQLILQYVNSKDKKQMICETKIIKNKNEIKNIVVLLINKYLIDYR